jgi:hypothetical protein
MRRPIDHFGQYQTVLRDDYVAERGNKSVICSVIDKLCLLLSLSNEHYCLGAVGAIYSSERTTIPLRDLGNQFIRPISSVAI